MFSKLESNLEVSLSAISTKDKELQHKHAELETLNSRQPWRKKSFLLIQALRWNFRTQGENKVVNWDNKVV